MKAYVLDRYGKKRALRLADLPSPALRDDEVLVQVHAAGVNLLDSKVRDGEFKLILPYRLPIVLGHDVAGVVVTHGTDTLEETAWFLQRVLAPAKPVVLSAAMRPATALQSDGPQNLLDAVTVAQLQGARGVVAVLGGQLFGARDVRKLHPYRIDAFGAGDAGIIGVVEEGRLRQFRDWPSSADAIGADALPDDAAAYAARVRALPAMQDWEREAREEADFLDFDEPYRNSR